MPKSTRADSPTKVCTAGDCDRPLRAKGYCAYHYRVMVNPARKATAVTCPTCGEITMKRDAARRFCSLLCRDVWRIETGNNPAPPQAINGPTKCNLPTDHPVRVLIRANAIQRSPIRLALEQQDWPTLGSLMEARAVKVDQCWLWGRQSKSGYGSINIAGRQYGAHRLMAMAAAGCHIPSHMPVHHKCAERLCINPAHLQVVKPHENVAEMLERRHYTERIAALEAALRDLAPRHPLVAQAPALRVA